MNWDGESWRVGLQKHESMDLMHDFNKNISEKCLGKGEGVPEGY